MALIGVLWLMAALSIMVAGLSTQVRQEVRVTSSGRDLVAAQALGDAALQLVLQKIRADEKLPDQWMSFPVSYAGSEIEVQVTPLSGLIDLNRVDAALLSQALQVAGQLESATAQQLANNIVEFRQSRDSANRVRKFEAEEDLLQVPGMRYDLYARLAPLLTLEGRGSNKVNAMAAPAQVLWVLANGNQQIVDAIVAKRRSGDPSMDFSSLKTEFIDTSTSTRLKLTALVSIDLDRKVQVSRHVDVMASSPDGSPWISYRVSSSMLSTSVGR